jgi:hypothetical protein
MDPLRRDGETPLCDDHELAYLASRTPFEQGRGLALDDAYRLAHLPLVAPNHPGVIARRDGTYYDRGRHDCAWSLGIPVADQLLRLSEAYLTLEAELKASALAPKIAWNIVELRRHKLHATICGSLSVGTSPSLDRTQRDALRALGPISVGLRGLFSGNVNRGRLYLRAYPEKRDGINMIRRIQQVMGRPETLLYVVGLYNLVDDLDAAEAIVLSDLIARWWDRPVLRFQVDALWLLGATDDLVLGDHTVETIPLV